MKGSDRFTTGRLPTLYLSFRPTNYDARVISFSAAGGFANPDRAVCEAASGMTVD
jgi:hypothetical protein